MRHPSLVMVVAGSVACASARQTATAVSPVPDSSVFAPLSLRPVPGRTRLANGAPGPRYWQNRADYDLQATLDPAAQTVRGTMTLRYTNNSPDVLPFLWFQMEQNAFRKENDTARANPYGDVIDQFTEVVDGRPAAVPLEEHGTEAKATLPRPLKPGEVATFHVAWHFVVPPRKFSIISLRMGWEPGVYQVAQWYPRVNVYDDAKGWNTEPYLGDTEFYLEYGNYTLAVTAPADYIVGATGTLDNPRDVLTPTEIARLAQAARVDTIVPIVTAAELANGTAHLKRDGMVTWRFHAKNVRDAVWVASPNYQWDATSWKGILAQAYYRPALARQWHKAAAMARASIQEYSERWYPYPYPQVSVAEGIKDGIPYQGGVISGGMEYPMLAFDCGGEYSLLTHEVGHNWFPMIVGSNERVHEWMDEGFNTFINSFSEARWDPKAGDQNTIIGHRVYRGTQRAIVGGSYNGTAYLLQLLRRDILGPAVFDNAFRTYIRRWAYKHPTPADFFRTMEDVSKQNLAWFWNGGFKGTPHFDQSIDSVSQTALGGKTHVTVTYGNRARMVLPLLVRFTFADGTTRDTTAPVDVWRANSTRYTATYTFNQPVKSITLDPNAHLPDANTSNNTWTAK